jgi:hypothetical protein
MPSATVSFVWMGSNDGGADTKRTATSRAVKIRVFLMFYEQCSADTYCGFARVRSSFGRSRSVPHVFILEGKLDYSVRGVSCQQFATGAAQGM